MGSKTDSAHQQFMLHSKNAIEKFRAAKALAEKGVPWEEIDHRTLRLVSSLLADARREMDEALRRQDEYLKEMSQDGTMRDH
jgi:hypothetical protein